MGGGDHWSPGAPKVLSWNPEPGAFHDLEPVTVTVAVTVAVIVTALSFTYSYSLPSGTGRKNGFGTNFLYPHTSIRSYGSFTHSFTYSLIHQFACSFVRSDTRLFVHQFIQQLLD